MNDNYVRFDLYWESPIDNILLQSGKYIFRDSNLQLHDFGAIYYVLRYVTNYNLNDLELFLRLNGFSAFSNDEMMNEYSHAYTFSLNKNNNIAHFCTEEEAIKEIPNKNPWKWISLSEFIKNNSFEYYFGKQEDWCGFTA